MWIAIDTSGERCSVALETRAGLLLRQTDTPRQHARSVAPFMQELLTEAGGDGPDGAAIARAALTGVVVVAGPGSYTGLRIGVSSAKGLCYALGLPLHAVSTLDYLVGAAGWLDVAAPDAPVFAVERARRGELHAGGPGLPDQVMEDLAFRDFIQTERADSGAILVVRDTRLADELIDADFVTPDRLRIVHPDARDAIRIVRSTPHSYLVQDMAPFEPFYLKDFVARSSGA